MKESVVRTKSFEFALQVIALYKELQEKREFVLSKQLLRSGTSVGANIEEASAAQSRKDFISKMSIAAKEARETHYWLKLLDASRLADAGYSKPLQKVEELIRLLTAIVKTTSET